MRKVYQDIVNADEGGPRHSVMTPRNYYQVGWEYTEASVDNKTERVSNQPIAAASSLHNMYNVYYVGATYFDSI